MISAYFLTGEKKPETKLLKRILTLWCRVIFYSWLILVIDLFIGFSPIGRKSLIKSIFPILGNEYWFVTSFFLLIFLVPFLNRLIQGVSKKQFIAVLVVMIVLYFQA